MNTRLRYFNILVSALVVLLLYPGFNTAEAEDNPILIDLMPGRYVSVKGDAEKFRAHHWMSEGYAGGVKNISMEQLLSGDTLLDFEGHAIHADNDIGGALLLKNDHVGIFNVHYDTFRKYYDGTGGSYDDFTTLNAPELDDELHMDIGNLQVEITPSLEDLHDVTFLYEHHTKEGTKSRLSLAEVEESVTRNIAPVPQNISETTDVLGLSGKTTLAGFEVEGGQRYEKVESASRRIERDISTTTTAGDKIVRIQYQDPTSEIYRTTLQGERWLNEDKSFMGFAYRYESLENDELVNLVETNEAGSALNGSQKVNGYAQNTVDDHTLVGNFMAKILPELNLVTKFKTGLMTRVGEALYPQDDSPYGVIDSAESNDTRNKVLLWGESFGLRYSGIKRTSLYADVDLNQMKNDLKEEQHNLAGALLWNRHTIASTAGTVFSVGGRVIPSSKVNVTTQFKRRFEDTDFDHRVKNRDSGINSAFFDTLHEAAYESSLKLTWKPVQKIQNSFRYQLLDNIYESRVEDQNEQTSKMLSHIFTYDLFMQPLEVLLLNFSVSQQNSKTTTAAGANTSTHVPGFKADVQSALFSASYVPSEVLSYIGTFVYSHSDNFNDFVGLPLGVSNARYNGQLGMKWSPKNKDWTVEPNYAYYNYHADSATESGDYSAHVGWLDFSYTW